MTTTPCSPCASSNPSTRSAPWLIGVLHAALLALLYATIARAPAVMAAALLAQAMLVIPLMPWVARAGWRGVLATSTVAVAWVVGRVVAFGHGADIPGGGSACGGRGGDPCRPAHQSGGALRTRRTGRARGDAASDLAVF